MVPKCPEPSTKVSRPKVRSVLVPKCLGSEVSGHSEPCAEVSGHSGPCAEVSIGHLGTGSEVSQCRSVLVYILKNVSMGRLVLVLAVAIKYHHCLSVVTATSELSAVTALVDTNENWYFIFI